MGGKYLTEEADKRKGGTEEKGNVRGREEEEEEEGVMEGETEKCSGVIKRCD